MRPKQRKLPAWVARWAQRDRAFAALIFRHPEVAERLDAVERFRNAKDSLPSAQGARAVGYPRSTLYDWDALYKEDPASLVNGSRRRKTAPARILRTAELRTTEVPQDIIVSFLLLAFRACFRSNRDGRQLRIFKLTPIPSR